MNKTTEALKLAEEALVMYCEHGAIFKPNETLAAIREALADHVEQSLTTVVEPVKQEPVAWAYIDADGSFMDALDRQHGAYQTPLYAAPAQPVKQEPVAWRYNSNGDWIYKDRKVWDAAEPLYAAPVDAKAIRAEALEEAAKVCEQGTGNAVKTGVLKVLLQERDRIAAAIRGLK